VLSLPHALRYRLAWDHALCRAVLDGVFATASDGPTRFDPAPPPTDRDVARLLATIRTRILRLLRRRGVLAPDGEDVEADPLAIDVPVLAQRSAAAVRGRSAFGDRAGTPVLRVGRDPDAPWVWTVGPRHAHLERFDLPADRDVRADDRLGLERLCRYLLRPPLAQARLSRLPDGRVVCTLRHPWHDGTRHLIFTGKPASRAASVASWKRSLCSSRVFDGREEAEATAATGAAPRRRDVRRARLTISWRHRTAPTSLRARLRAREALRTDSGRRGSRTSDSRDRWCRGG
jgi:hypothetical protein